MRYRAVGRGKSWAESSDDDVRRKRPKKSIQRSKQSTRRSQDIIALGRMDSMLEARDKLDQGYLVGMLADRGLGAMLRWTAIFWENVSAISSWPFPHGRHVAPPGLSWRACISGGNRYQIHFGAAR